MRGDVLPQGKAAREELRGDLGDGRPRPQLVQSPNELQGDKAFSHCMNLTGVAVRLSRGLLAEVVKVVPFYGETGEGVIEFRP